MKMGGVKVNGYGLREVMMDIKFAALGIRWRSF